MLPFPKLRALIFLQSRIEPTHKVYQITLEMYLECTCLDFVDVVVSMIGGHHQYENYKHLYYLFHYFCKMNLVEDNCIHSPSFSFNEVKRLFIRAGIMKVPNEYLQHT